MLQNNIQIKINSFLKPIPHRQIPKCVSIFFLSLLFGLGFDFGFTNVLIKKYRSYLKLLSVIVSILILLLLFVPLFYDLNSVRLSLYGLGCFQFSIQVAILLVSKYNIYHFLTDIYKIHNTIYDKEYKFLWCALAYYLINWTLKLITCVWHCSVKPDYCFTLTVIIPVHPYCLLITAWDVAPVAQILIYFYVHASLKYLRKLMENKCIYLSNARKQFIMIADSCDKISAFYGNMVSIVFG